MQIDMMCRDCPLIKIAAKSQSELSFSDDGAPRLCADLKIIDKGVVLSKDICSKGKMLSICSGVLGLQHDLPDGRRSLTELFMRGDLVIKNRVPVNAQIVALTKTKICCRPMENLSCMNSSSTDLKAICAERLGEQSSQLSIHCADVAMKTPPERLAAFLCEYCDRGVAEYVDGKNTRILLSRTAIANYIASEPETVSRSFSKLANAGAIEMYGRYNVQVSNKMTLRKIADGGLPRLRRTDG